MSESALIRAVRDRIRASDTFIDRQVEVEWDEMAPAVVGDLYVMVFPGGVDPGPTHETNAGAADKLYHVDVSVAIRAPRKPRDRQRELFVGLSASFEIYTTAIETQIDFNYATINAANAYILAETTSQWGFTEPLKFGGLGPIRAAPVDLFAAASGETVPALIRTIHFRNARRQVVRS